MHGEYEVLPGNRPVHARLHDKVANDQEIAADNIVGLLSLSQSCLK